MEIMSNFQPYTGRVITSGRPATVSPKASLPKSSAPYQGKDFKQVLEKIVNGQLEIRFSKHAEQRLAVRNIKLTPLDLEQIGKAVKLAENKGIKDTLVFMQDKAFIVNVPSKTVITAVNGDSLNENVFTNIDGAVIL